MKILSVLVCLLSLGSASAAEPDFTRTFSWPFTGKEFSLTEPNGDCEVEAGCFRVENRTAYWLSPGIEGEPGADPGNALVVDYRGIVHGVYLGERTVVGRYPDPVYGRIDAVQGDFRPAIKPNIGTPTKLYLTVDAGVDSLVADAIQFRQEMALPDEFGVVRPLPDHPPVYDLRLQRTVIYTVGTGQVVKQCSTTNDVTDPTDSPEVAGFITQHCYPI